MTTYTSKDKSTLPEDEYHRCNYTNAHALNNYLEQQHKSIQQLDISYATTNDKTLQILTQYKNLTWLNLDSTNTTYKGLKHLATLQKLKVLHLGYSNITNKEIKALQPLTTLEELYLSDTEITNEGLRYLSTLKNLTDLVLSNTNITNRGLKYLTTLPKLTYLTLSGTPITKIPPLPIIRLSIKRTKFTEKDLFKLALQKNLEAVIISAGSCAQNTQNILQRLMPNLRIGYGI